MFFDEPEPHGFWLAKNWVAFFRMSLSSRNMRFSRRSRSFSRASSRSSDETTSVSRCAVIHLFSVDIPTPRSSAICLRESPLVSAIRTASLRNSSVLAVHSRHRLTQRSSPALRLQSRHEPWSYLSMRRMQPQGRAQSEPVCAASFRMSFPVRCEE